MEDGMMKRYYRIILLMFFIILIPTKVEALCDYNAGARLKSIAANVTFSTNYVEGDSNVELFVTIANLHPEIYIKDVTNYKYYYYNTSAANPREVKVGGYFPGRAVKYEFYTKNVGCTGEVLLVRYVTFPSYNRFYNDPLCIGIENYSLCQKWIKTNLSYGQFKNKIEAYRNKVIDEPVKEIPEDQPIHINVIAELWEKYYVSILVVTIMMCMAFIIRIKKKDTFDLS